MASPLSYLLIIQKSGLPVYAQSFEFEDDDACKSFNKILKPVSNEANAHLMGGYFSSMQLFADEMVEDKLNLIELGFKKFEILGLIKEEVFFVGIFQNFPDQPDQKQAQMEFLEGVSSKFIQRYPLDEIHNDFVDHASFVDFTNVIQELSKGEISVNHCRNCLTKCTVENKGCLPHSFYFDKVSFSNDFIELND